MKLEWSNLKFELKFERKGRWEMMLVRVGRVGVRAALCSRTGVARGFATQQNQGGAKEEMENVVHASDLAAPSEEEAAAENARPFPWFISDDIVPDVDEPAPPGAQENVEELVAKWLPPHVMQDRSVRIFKQPKSAMEEGDQMTWYWSVELERRAQWTNQLMEYQSAGDPFDGLGLSRLMFRSAEEAVSFCKRNGFAYEVEEPPFKESFEGKNEYATNFLNEHVRTRRERLPPKSLMRREFAHKEKHKPTWVNLQHTDFGKTASKSVSQTHWTKQHPKNHKPSDWYNHSFKHRQELARKVGK